ncbi:MAG: catechol 1,2-dioxygenase [Deltaproteobacteria bacterium]|jgi:3,4-dihydroxyphenylacetate 2,3-dioxygenase|nr:catechol 1,2-dioxygenase [Deltaproteobacteria bacterium]
MGQIVAAAVVSHQPGIMAPEAARKAMSNGVDTTLVPGFADLREGLDAARPDTLVIFDTHWFTTLEHVVAGAERYRGTYTSDELPRILADVEYDFPGAPELGALAAEVASERGVRLLNAENPHIAMQYPPLNLLHFLHRGEGVLRVGTCQQAERHNFLELGEVLAEATARSSSRVALLGAGGMSHRFPVMDESAKHMAFGAEQVISEEARAIDERILDLWSRGDHAAVIDLYPEYSAFKPEGFFGHYLAIAGALGGRGFDAKGRRMSEYENALGTGQVHVWFDLPA